MKNENRDHSDGPQAINGRAILEWFHLTD